MVRGNRLRQTASVCGPRDVQDILTPGWLARSVGWNVLGSSNQRPSQSLKCKGRVSALRVEQREVTRANENLQRTHKLESGRMTGPQPWNCKGKGRAQF